MQKHTHAHQDASTRKHELLRDGEFYRSGLLHSAIDHATWALRARADALLKPTGTNLSVLAPYAMTVLGFIRKRRLGKPALGLAALAGVAAWYLQRKRAQQLAY